MEIVIDTSVLLAVVAGEPSRERAIDLTAGHSLVAPGSVHWEIGNALSAMIERKRMTPTEANACVAAYLRIPIRHVDVDLVRALAVVQKLPIYAYDVYFLVVARQLGSPLLTLDRSLAAHATSLGLSVLEI